MDEKLRVGAIGAAVAHLHEELQLRKFVIPDSELRREFFGPGTREAVLACQREHGLGCSGEVDGATTALLSGNPPPGAGGITVGGATAGGVTRTSNLGPDAPSHRAECDARRTPPTGVMSSWRIDLPPDFRQFDYATISDIVLHLRDTARDGGATLRSAAVTSLTNTVKAVDVEEETTGLYRLFSVAHDFPDAWQAFRFRPRGAAGAVELVVTLDPRRFPAYLRDRTLKLTDLTLFLKVAPGVAYDEGDPLILAVTPPGGAEQPVTLTPVETELGRVPAGQADYGGAPITLSAAQPPWRLTISGLPAVLTEEVEVNGRHVQRLDSTKVTDLGLLCHYTYYTY